MTRWVRAGWDAIYLIYSSGWIKNYGTIPMEIFHMTTKACHSLCPVDIRQNANKPFSIIIAKIIIHAYTATVTGSQFSIILGVLLNLCLYIKPPWTEFGRLTWH